MIEEEGRLQEKHSKGKVVKKGFNPDSGVFF
jgi:hypothetical protein